MNTTATTFLCSITVCLSLGLSLANAGEYRTLTNSDGKKIKTELLTKKDGKITFKLQEERKKFTVPIDSLSEADQNYLKTWTPEGGDWMNEDPAEPEASGAKSLYPKSKQEIRSEIREIMKRKSDAAGAVKEQKATNTLNVYRYLSGVPYDVEMDPDLNSKCAEAANICKEKGTLSHDFGHYTNKSNLSSMGDMVASVPQYIDDSGANNRDKRGHRRWCLNPGMEKTGFGSGGSRFSAMWSMDGAHKKSRLKSWSYPGKGYYPKDYMHGTAWSLYLNEKAPSRDKVKVEIYKLKKPPTKKLRSNEVPDGKEIGVKYIFTYMNTINFEPDDFTAGDRGVYWVRVTGSGLKEGYVVEFF